jgi:hypothetical protein
MSAQVFDFTASDKLTPEQAGTLLARDQVAEGYTEAQFLELLDLVGSGASGFAAEVKMPVAVIRELWVRQELAALQEWNRLSIAKKHFTSGGTH